MAYQAWQNSQGQPHFVSGMPQPTPGGMQRPAMPNRFPPPTTPPVPQQRMPISSQVPMAPPAPDTYQRTPQNPLPAAAPAPASPMAQIQQALGQTPQTAAGPTDPNAPPKPFENPLMPGGPVAFVAGGAAGVGLGEGLKYAFGNGAAADNDKIFKLAQKLDGALSRISQPFGDWIKARLDRPDANKTLRTMFKYATPTEVEAQMKDRILKNAEKRFAKGGGQVVIKDHLSSATSLEELQKRVDSPSFREAMSKAGFPDKKIVGMSSYTKGQTRMLGDYTRHQQMLQKLKAKGVGPIGRGFYSTLNHIRRIFGMEMMKHSGQKFGFLNKMAPFLGGAMIFGQAFGEAKKAEGGKGEKAKTFFHNFLGSGLGLFAGWEISRQLFRPAGLFDKILGKRSLATLLPFVRKFSVGGFAAEILCMTLLAIPFQKVGEGISHLLFGKPQHEKKAENEAKGIFAAKPIPGSLNRSQSAFQSAYSSPTNPSAPTEEATTTPASVIPVDSIRNSPIQAQQDQLAQSIINSLGSGGGGH